jgi:L,D-transpeptidase ErfK/SrfK
LIERKRQSPLSDILLRMKPVLVHRYFFRALLCLVAALTLFAVVAQAAANDMIGDQRKYLVREDDTLYDIARYNGLGITELRTANPGIDPWLPPLGQEIVLPTAHLLPSGPRRGIVINLGDQRLYVFGSQADDVSSYPIGIGHAATATPVGTTTVVRKRENPTWIPPASIREAQPTLPAAVAPGPGNPLGKHALDLGWPSYVVHGTNRPYGIGRRISHGCIRLRADDIAQVFKEVAIGTPVRVVDEPVKLGWSEGELFLEAHPTQDQADQIDETGSFTFAGYGDLMGRVAEAAGKQSKRIDWNLVRRVADQRRGVPVRITRRSPS